MLIIIASVLAGAMLASTLMLQFTSNDSWLAFVGWVIFFVSIQAPFLLMQSSREYGCTAWLGRLLNRRAKP